MKLRLKKATLAVIVEASQRNLAMVPEGSDVEVSSEPLALGAFGLVNIRWHGHTMMVFAEDLRERGEYIDGGNAAFA